MSRDLLDGLGPRLDEQRGRIPTTAFELREEQIIHQGAVVGFHQGTIIDGDGNAHARDIIRHPGAVSIVPVDDEMRVTMVQQYRTAVDADLLELPAGKRDRDEEPPELTAHRELEEEVGLRAASMELLCNIHHSPGFCDEYGYIFLATDLSPVPVDRKGPEEQVMQIRRIPLAKAASMCLDGGITDAKSVAGILAAARRFGC